MLPSHPASAGQAWHGKLLRLRPHPNGVAVLPPFYGLMFLGARRLIPLWVAWVGCFGLCRELAARKKVLSDWRLSWILACAAWGAMLTLVVEGCSALRQLNTSAPFIIWAVLSGSLAGTAVVLARKRGALSYA